MAYQLPLFSRYQVTAPARSTYSSQWVWTANSRPLSPARVSTESPSNTMRLVGRSAWKIVGGSLFTAPLWVACAGSFRLSSRASSDRQPRIGERDGPGGFSSVLVAKISSSVPRVWILCVLWREGDRPCARSVSGGRARRSPVAGRLWPRHRLAGHGVRPGCGVLRIGWYADEQQSARSSSKRMNVCFGAGSGLRDCRCNRSALSPTQDTCIVRQALLSVLSHIRASFPLSPGNDADVLDGS